MIKTSYFLPIYRCSTFLDAHISVTCSASKKALRLILEEITLSNGLRLTAHAALLGSSCSSRTNLNAPGTQNLTPCLSKNYLLIKFNVLSKALRSVLKKNTCSNPSVLQGYI